MQRLIAVNVVVRSIAVLRGIEEKVIVRYVECCVLIDEDFVGSLFKQAKHVRLIEGQFEG